MTDRDRFELEMSPGMQPPSGLGDRVLVGLALVVLIGAAVIVVGKVLPDPDQVAQGSEAPSSHPQATPRPLPSPKPPRVASLTDPDVEFSPQQQNLTFYGWVRALNDLVVRSEPDPEAIQVGVLKKDDIASGSTQGAPQDGSNWFLLDEAGGWIATRVDGVEQVRRYDYPTYEFSGYVNSVLAGANGFVAMVAPPSGLNGYEPPRPAGSADGDGWTGTDEALADSWNGGSLAWGPAEWLAATYVTDEVHGRVWIWSSGDGLHWTRLGMLGGLDHEYVAQLLGNEDGYLLETYDEQGGSSPGGGSLWSSTDGRTWVESKDPLLDHSFSERHIAALDHGYYMWDTGPQSNPFAAYSADGQTWTALDHGPDGVALQLTDFGEGVVAIDLNRATLAPRVWSAVVADGTLSWIRESAADTAFEGGVVQQLVSDGSRVYAFGWDLATEQPLVWTGNGARWTRSTLPDEFGGIPAMAAAGPSGVVVVGHRPSLRGDNPIFWHRAATGRWVPESQPLMAEVPDPTTDCQDLPSEFLEFVIVDSAALVSCHGDTPFTLRAYSVACGDCFGTMDGDPQPAWLLNPNRDQLLLAPDVTTGNWSSQAVLGPSLVPIDPAWTGTWLDVTGHFDDPAASTCRIEPRADTIQWWTGGQLLIDQCRLTFVVTDVKVLSGP